MTGSAFTRSYTANHFSPVGYGLLGVKRALATRQALADNSGIFVNQDGHVVILSQHAQFFVLHLQDRPLQLRLVGSH